MAENNSGNIGWRVNENLQQIERNKEEHDRLAQVMVKEIKERGHARNLPDLPENLKNDPDWKRKITDNKATGAMNVLISIGGTIQDLLSVFQKMYNYDKSLFDKWGGFLDNDTGEPVKNYLKKHIEYIAGINEKNRPTKGFNFESTKPLENLKDDDYFKVVGTWSSSNKKDYISKSVTDKPKWDIETKNKKTLEYNMRNIYDYFESKGFVFSREILTRYFLSLKTKPFVILTGISGTGKTKIAQIFADYMCQNLEKNEKEKQIAFISVRPDWMDNKGLLGFYNILDEKYYETSMLNLILRAGQNPDIPYFVILDEMNLSKVELYFSDFLSIMESRTSDNKKGESLFIHSINDALSLNENIIPGTIFIPQNLYITGTVNVDETTYMFSPKVLDRANVIEFNEVDPEGYMSKNRKDEHFFLENPDILDDLIDREIEPYCSIQDYEKFKHIIENEDKDNPIVDLINRLKFYNLHFGYRVINEISRFIWLSENYIKEGFETNMAFDIQILQKILPKLHGTRGKLESPLKDLLSFCYGNSNWEESVSDETIEKALNFDENAIYPRSAKKIGRMLMNLNNQGYVSFIE